MVDPRLKEEHSHRSPVGRMLRVWHVVRGTAEKGPGYVGPGDSAVLLHLEV